ncbi:hypothetical protein CIP107546_00368 [Corynebacterium diphtheriae]|nr:hypothetical protein CIP107546_00368 [Corynebacterium diphtheriae]CAB0587426.1 hypothetical protein CIP107559_00570 [Corynebacterium diphtheriae]CAB0632168.1 hypothetical protein FRC0016_00390 [Corynebacterium diphtheriae]CAB0680226.1 hypothetical protein FRC0076_00444 [Corynebacterium diphtheriae]CAB0680920.1 hypothetical protein FRC0077_00457 [Corynebacterium diphtheriae]
MRNPDYRNCYLQLKPLNHVHCVQPIEGVGISYSALAGRKMFAGGCAIYATGKEIKGGGVPPLGPALGDVWKKIGS